MGGGLVATIRVKVKVKELSIGLAVVDDDNDDGNDGDDDDEEEDNNNDDEYVRCILYCHEQSSWLFRPCVPSNSEERNDNIFVTVWWFGLVFIIIMIRYNTIH